MHPKENMVAFSFHRILLAGVILVLGLGPLGCLCGTRVTAQSQTSQTKDRKVAIARPMKGLERRVALVIGNGNYPFGSLRNPVNDATDMAKTLTNLGFEVISRTDVTQREMLALISAFGRQLHSGDVGLFYFAGHGVQVSGDNFLIPVDAEIKTDADVDVYCVELNKVLKQMQTAGNRFNIVILDACRNNPFLTRSWRNTQPGLAEVKATSGMYIAFATSPGATASDGTGRNGLYTQALLQALNQPGIPIEQTFKTVFREVKQKSNGQQLPYLLPLFDGDFYFLPEQPTPEPEPEKPAVAIPSAAAIEEEAWKVVQNSNRPEDFEAFLAEYPTGDRAKMARIMLSKLTPKKEPALSREPKTRPAPPEPESGAAPPIPKAESRPVPTSVPAPVPARKKRVDSSLKSLKTTRLILDRGLNKLTHGEYDGAIQDLYQARELDPTQTHEIGQSLARAYYLRGLTRKNQQNFSGAILDLKSSVELNPNLAEAHAALGRLYFREENLEAAIPSSQRALDLDPQNTQYRGELLKQYLQLGGHQHETAQFEKAELAYTAALKLSPSDALIHTHLG
ncbi:MAG TPA: caspase family protein, partial [Acidobacteriota bacterium]|nr:caspase family protein [Acidobacteriota bacterium]